MVDVPVTIALADADARIVDRLDCSTSVARVLDRVDFLKGFAFVEGGVGTNGIGTVFEAGPVGGRGRLGALQREAGAASPAPAPRSSTR